MNKIHFFWLYLARPPSEVLQLFSRMRCKAHLTRGIVVSLILVGFNTSIQADEINLTPGASQIESAFSPDGGSEALVVKVINSAKKTIRLAAYSFTSPTIVRALINAKRRGVDVAVVADYNSNITDDRHGRSRAALNLLVNAGIVTRLISRYPIHHDKFIIADNIHVETGSFNYSISAAKRNSENVIVIWNNPKVANSYLMHWQSRYDQGSDYTSNY